MQIRKPGNFLKKFEIGLTQSFINEDWSIIEVKISQNRVLMLYDPSFCKSRNMFPEYNWQEISLRHSANSNDTPKQRWGHRLLNINSQLYLFGGFGGVPEGQGKYLNDLWRFDLASATWQPLKTTGQYPQPRSNYTIHHNEVNNELLLFGGGAANKVRYNAIFLLNLQTNVWRKVTPPENSQSPWERTYHISQFLYPYLVVFGGEGVSYIDLNDTWVFDVRTDEWRKLSPGGQTPIERRFAASAIIGTDFYLVGGCNDNYSLIGDMHKLSLKPLFQDRSQDLKWQCLVKENRLLERWGHTCDVFNDKIYIFAGRVSASQDSNQLIQYDPSSGNLTTIQTQGKAPKPRRRQGSTIVGDCLLVMGGYNGCYLKDFSFIKLQQEYQKPFLEVKRTKNSKQIQKELNRGQQRLGSLDFLEVVENKQKVKIQTDFKKILKNPFFKTLYKYHNGISVELPPFCSLQTFRSINLALTQGLLLLNEQQEFKWQAQLVESLAYFCCYDQLKQLENYLINLLTEQNFMPLLQLSITCELGKLNQAASIQYFKKGIKEPQLIIPQRQVSLNDTTAIHNSDNSFQIVLTNQKMNKSLHSAYKKHSFEIKQKILLQNHVGLGKRAKKFFQSIFSFTKSTSRQEQLSREQANKQKCCGRALIEYLQTVCNF